MVQRLPLSQAEIKRLDDAFIVSRKKLIELKSHVEIAQLELESSFDAPELDEPALMKRYGALEKARAALGRERFKFVVEVRKIIGHDKFQQLMRIKRNRDRMRQGAPPDNN